MRSDKDLESGGARLEQIVKNPVLPSLEKAAPAKPQILRREVYAKAEAVRKLVIVRQSAENCVPYLVYWTDFSAKRKDPLKVSTAFALTENRANALAERLIAENVTKGFVRTDGVAAVAAAQTESPKAKTGEDDKSPGAEKPAKRKKA
jgi:hypothetical protein